jgi:hypothetical protein
MARDPGDRVRRNFARIASVLHDTARERADSRNEAQPLERNLIMNAIRIASSLLVLSALCVDAAQAQTAPTREQVKAEFAQAVRDGDVVPAGEGMSLRQLHPERYSARMPIAVAKTRAEVKAEYAEAVRTGDIIATGDSGLKLNELNPQAYPATTFAGIGKTREQVKLELAEAIRTGDVMASGDVGLKLNELYPQRYAAARATRLMAQRASAAASAVSR